MIDKIKELGLDTVKFILLIATFIFALFVLLAFLQIGFIYWIYALVEEWVAVRLGFDYYISNLFATIFTTLFSLLTPTLLWYIFLGKRKAWGIGTIVGIQFLICFSVYTIGNGVCFDRRKGKALCYYVDTPKGRVWSYTPGYDPVSGEKFRLYTREIKRREDLRVKTR